MDIKTETIAELTVEIEFEHFADEDPRFSETNVKNVYLFGVPLTDEQKKKFIEDYGKNYLDDLCMDEIKDMAERSNETRYYQNVA